ncbi:uncharacterized protein BKA55DRAFT_531398 [Fusarium redolens]|uniref:Uncharacterized protein n=1 Tax=Fusarium redolens TaxID=48865 RepID=A0A9P9FU61_FUSRE|nr:uncharacterized protein BKA55DRAFT_531398 [Fusarium redolens]KAH7202856.1 hypothetical protein BKA55DRAFT_531398 [Fusarium redolens]
MDKVWFKLRHSHNPAPDVSTLGTNQETGPVLLGHFIPDLNHLDQVINRGGIKVFPGEMKVWLTRTINFRWDSSKSHDVNACVSATAPAAVAAGADVQSSASAAFRGSVENFAEFEALDCFIVDPVKSYIDNYLAEGPVADHITSHKLLGTWKLFMITGIMIARGAKTSDKDQLRGEGHMNTGLSVPGIVGTKIQTDVVEDRSQSSSGSSVTDFVWAIRLAKITKSLGEVILQRDWSMITETSGATFAPNEGEVDVAHVVYEEGMENIGLVIEDEDLDMAFVLK